MCIMIIESLGVTKEKYDDITHAPCMLNPKLIN